MIYASAALKSAERSLGERKSPDLFRRAETSYWKAKEFYLAKEYESCRQAAISSRRLAEAAELDAELKDAGAEE